MRPVIFFAFANDKELPLDSLKEESRSLERILRPLHQKEVLELYIKENINNEDLYESMLAYDSKVMLFHYAGHADEYNLFLDGESAHAEGLAQLFATQKEHLKLVFLNGCCTAGQVDKLLSLGIKAVIATSQSIPDTKASKFAKVFYQALSRNNTLGQAFAKAASFLKTQFNEEASVFRRMDFRPKEERAELPWGLYIQEGNEEILRWKLPQFVPVQINIKQVEPSQYTVNEYFEEILPCMQKYDSSINSELKDLDRSDYLNTVIRMLPYPIAVQFQKLVSSDLKDLNRNRLKQILSTYLISSKLIYFFLLSQLWDEQHTQSLQTGFKLGNWHNLAEHESLFFDYAKEAHKIYKELKKNGIPVFLKEYSAKHEEFKEEAFINACKFLQELKLKVPELEENQSYPELCEKAERNLSYYLKTTAFLVRYELYGIRDIYLYRPRYENEVYKHRYALLKLSLKDSISVREQPLDSLFPTDNNSVILLRKDKSGLDEYLSLSPFIIDKNAFSSKNDSEIFFMTCKKDEDVIYHRVKSSIYKAIRDKDDQIFTLQNREEENLDYLTLVQKQVNIFETDFNLV